MIDESLVKFRGCTRYRQFIPSKQSHFGLKIFCLTDTHGLLYDFEFYSGTTATQTWARHVPGTQELSVVERLVVHLLDRAGFLDRGFNVIIDNYFNSSRLQEYLLTRQTTAIGMVRKNRGISRTISTGNLRRPKPFHSTKTPRTWISSIRRKRSPAGWCSIKRIATRERSNMLAGLIGGR